MANKILAGILAVMVLGAGVYFFTQDRTPGTNNNQQTNPTPTPTPSEVPPPPPVSADLPDKVVVTFETSKGNFDVTLDHKAAPKTVENFVKLAEDGYCEGTKFHRIIQVFMIQGCDPNSKDTDPANDGQGGPGYTVPAEIGLKHNIGAIAMARTGDSVNPTKASSGSQFFIVTQESENTHLSLDGQYTAFGYVTSGMDVVTKIAATKTQNNPYTGERASMPTEDVIIKKITVKK